MAKNNWLAGDTGTRSRMNQPFFLASGTVVSGDVILQVGPGRMRFPHRNLTVFSNGAQSLTLSNAAAATYYSIFLKGDGTFLASGHTTWADNPNPPHPESEYLGTIFTGASLSTANLKGPWLIPSGQYEGRGEYFAGTAERQRVVCSGGPAVNSFTQASDLFSIRSMGALPALSEMTVWEPPGAYSVFFATVCWVPSGALSTTFAGNRALYPSGVLQLGVLAAVERNNPTAAQPVEISIAESRAYVHPQNPDSTVDGSQAETMSLFGVSRNPAPATGAQATYLLRAGINTVFSADTANSNARVRSFSFGVIPGLFAYMTSG